MTINNIEYTNIPLNQSVVLPGRSTAPFITLTQSICWDKNTGQSLENIITYILEHLGGEGGTIYWG